MRKQNSVRLSLFLLSIELAAGAKRKVSKRETPGEVSPSADGEEGYAPSTCAHWRGSYGVLSHIA